ncbi:hypothetical protein AX17_004905 [Amanita inopinata Kibby_2008]|nr:hypothetical protein AX17_004905 [Amanita inopinata Kibby_2008]
MALVRRIAVVTGAASGIGRAIALRLADDGFDLALNDLNSSHDKLSEVAAQVAQAGAKTIVVTGDVSSEADVKNLVNDTVRELGGIDAMVANAGIANMTPIVQMTVDQWDQMMSVHARGAFLCYKYSIEQMIKQGRGGRVVGASSRNGKQGSPGAAHYSAAKFAIRGLTQSVAQEVGKYGITVNAYAPGIIRTPMLDGLGEAFQAILQEVTKTQVAMGREGTPEDVANVVSFLLSEKSDYITGQTVSVNGGFSVFD